MLKLGLAEPADLEGQGEAHGVEALLLAWDALQRRRHGQEGNGSAHLVASLPGHGAPCRDAAPRGKSAGGWGDGGAEGSPGLFLLRIEPREAVASQGGLSDGTTEGQHGQAPVLQLLELHLLDLGWIAGQELSAQLVVACRLERQARLVGNIAGLGKRGEHLNETAESEDLEERALLSVGAKEVLCVDKEREGWIAHAGVVCIHNGFRSIACIWTWDASELRNDEANKGEHRNAAMLQLGLTEVWHQLSLL
mmetsp:Transcript_108649/g.151869  ORF Transcript_108649/g.151869 Transcript_108649/m.151869 type:complete len:251 (-) Transcript_108649:73-825(-)